jgi:ribosomal protein L11 methyltransferase
LRTGAARISIRRVPSEDWAESWKKHFKPLEIGRALLIRPTWSHRPPRANQAVVALDPGLSFGTGQHPTTAFCLEQLITRRQPGDPQSFLDIGTGSGILAIAAAKLGYHPIHAFDCDSAAIRIAKANALQNHTEELIHFDQADLRRLPARAHRRFHLICANLVFDLLIEQSKRILSLLEPKGTLVLAGILAVQFATVRRVYRAAGLKLIETRTIEEWRSGAFTFR